MYFPIGWPRTLAQSDGDSPIKYVACNRYRMLFAVLTDEIISIWHCKPCVEILRYERGRQSIAETGPNAITEWRHDSSMLAVATTAGYLLIFQLEQDVKADKGVTLYEYQQNKTSQGENNDGVPALRLCWKTTIEYSAPIVSLSCVSEELLTATSNGELELIPWNGPFDKRKAINVQDMTFSVDLHSAGFAIRTKHPVYIVQLIYSPCLEGFTAVLSDGRAALIFITKSTHDKSKGFVWKAHGVWANGLTKAVCSAVNNRYRLMAFGTWRGSCEVYSMDDMQGCLQLSHQMTLSPKYYPDVYKNTGSVLDMQWTPDGCALAMSWNHGGFSIWSVYGSCLYCTLSPDHSFTVDGVRKQQSLFYSMCWGAEGYQLWLIQETKKLNRSSNAAGSSNHTCNNDSETADASTNSSSSSDEAFVSSRRSVSKSSTNQDKALTEREFIQVQFAKSALTMNPCSGNQSHVIVQAEDRVYVSFGENHYTSLISSSIYDDRRKKYVAKTYVEHGSPGRSFENIVGNKQWSIIQLPMNYLTGNWPIRFSSIDKTGKLLVVAGNFGLAHYSFLSRKWKLFGNIMQEKDMVVTGGLTWWDGLIIVACYNLVENQDEIRIYPHHTNLDNVFSYVKKVQSQILLINVYLNMVIVFDATCHVKIYEIRKEDKIEYQSATLVLLHDISMQRYVPYPSLVVSVMMTSLHMESSNRKHTTFNQQETEVLIINVAGRLLLLQHQNESNPSSQHPSESNPQKTRRDLNFGAPIVLASQVENLWASEYKSNQKVHLTDALWLCCGSSGLRVWIPLFPALRRSRSGDIGDHNVQALLSKRITLTLEMDSCYPLTVLFENAVVIGVKSETSYSFPGVKQEGDIVEYTFPFSTLERTCEMYLHQILRQLLRRNLGYHALQLAVSCRSLSYFPHVLELMLHKVLEEEATSSTPISDPLLPTIVKFIREFPEYLETVVHCARKTEIALWQYLFDSVGKPKELFEDCLEADQLETATSYLIILQNLEKLSLARQDATRLLSKALAAWKWSLAADIIRFLRAIGDGDQSTTPRHPQLMNTNIYPAVTPLHAIEEDTFSDNKIEREAVSKSSETSTRHARTYSTYYELYPQKTPVKSTPSLTGDHSASFHPYVPHPISSYHRHRPLQLSLSHPPSTEQQTRSDTNKLQSADEQDIGTECAEHYFIDIILSRQARQLLCDKNLLQLATFSAYLEFDLLPWLQKERSRAAKVVDAGECLKAVHQSFDWPYPAVIKMDKAEFSPVKPGQRRSSNLSKAQSIDRMDTFSSHSGSVTDLLSSVNLADNGLRSCNENYEMSDNSSLNEDMSNYVFDGMYDAYRVDKSAEPPQTREKISFMFEVLLEALCLEWALILAVALHDFDKLGQVLLVMKTEKFENVELDTLQRTRDCVAQLKNFAKSDTPEYEKVLLTMQDQFTLIGEIVNEKEVEYAERQAVIAQQAQLSSPESVGKVSRSRHTSRDETRKKLDDTAKAETTLNDVFVSDTTVTTTGKNDDGGVHDSDSQRIGDSEEEPDGGCSIA